MTDGQPGTDISRTTFAIAMVFVVAAFGGIWYATRPVDLPHGGNDEDQVRPNRAAFLPTVRNSVGMLLAHVPAGEFVMGDGRAANARPHPVRITKPYFIGVHEVTQAQYRAVIGRNPSEFVGPDEAPVESVTWDEARAFCGQLSSRPAEERSGRVYRLPTEAEWEYACRAGTTGLYWFGDAYRPDMANTKLGGLLRPSAVGLFPPNPWGLHDMHGNVWEWCSDWYSVDYYVRSPREDPQGPENGSERVTRGGSWDDRPEFARSGFRNDAFRPNHRGPQVGFRVACDMK